MTAISRREAIVLSLATLAAHGSIYAPTAVVATHCTLCGASLPERRRLRALCSDFGQYPEDNYCGRCLSSQVRADMEAMVRAHLASV